MSFTSRRLRNVGFAILVVVPTAILIGLQAFNVALYQEQFLSGWLLLGAILLLVLYNVRKKISMLPIGTAANWLQLHIYLGLISIFLFLLHINWRIPDGWLEGLLAVFFIGVSLSGVIGLYLNRRLSKLLTRRGEEVIFERIPGFIAKLRNEAEALVLECAVNTSSSTISDHYGDHLAPFFSGPKNLIRHFRGSRRALFDLVKQTSNMDRYLNDKEREFAEKLRQLIEKKDELDYQYSLQAILKAWLFVHIPLTYGMIILAAIHLVLAYAFSGGL
tara:strand:+ start:125 stop:949 length:825 start_codon:yes stop_codon:yes gene_type:complete